MSDGKVKCVSEEQVNSVSDRQVKCVLRGKETVSQRVKSSVS